MLTSDQFDTLVDPIVELYEEYQQSVINDIAKRLKRLGKVTELSAWQAQRLIESGLLYEETIKKLSKLTGISQVQLRNMFKQAGVQAIKFDDKIYKAAGLNPLPLNLSPAMLNVLSAGLLKTNNQIVNMTMTTAKTAQQLFIHQADLAYTQIANGAMSYDQAIRMAIENVADEGIEVVNFRSGHVDKLDVAMRRAVLTGVTQTTGKIQEVHADEMGSDLVQVSAHIGARNKGDGPENHESWQGKIYSRSGKSKKYPNFVEVTGYGSLLGLMGVNCRHSFFPYFEGLSPEVYRGAGLEEMKRKTANTPKGRMSVYDATQLQRSIERKIRFWKRRLQALNAGGYDTTFELNKVKHWQARMRQFTRVSNFNREYEREKV